MNEMGGEGGQVQGGRFDKFTERARRVLTLAQEEATRFNHNYIGTEHLLLGLVREADGVAARVLISLGVELQRVRSAVEHVVGRGDRMIVGEIGLTPRSRKVIELAVDEARRLGHHYIGTEHLLLGLVREGEGVAAGVLESLGVSLEKVRTQTIQVLSQGQGANMGEWARRAAAEGGGGMPNERFDKFTKGARRVLTLAQEEATRFNHNYIGDEHLLLGLTREGDSVAARVLANLGVELNRVRSAVEFIIGRGDRMIVGEIGLTPRAKKVIELAVDEARGLGHHYVGTEHLLLGLVRQGEGVGAGVLESLGIDLEKVRTQTVQVLSQGSGDDAQAEERTVPMGAGTALPSHSVGRHPWWSYLLVAVEHTAGEEGTRSVVTAMEGAEAALSELAGAQATERPALAVVLLALGEQGWELVAVDHPGAGSALYVFKRPGRGARRVAPPGS